MLPAHFRLRRVDLWNARGVEKNCDIEVQDGRVKSIVPASSAALSEEDLDGQGFAVLPAGLDLQVHLRVPGQPEKETARTGLRAALRGGFSAVLTMPNTQPVIDRPEVVEQARAELKKSEEETGVRALISAAMTLGQEGRAVVDAVALKKAGVVALTDDGKGVARDEVMREVFRVAAESGLPLLQHAEVPGHGGVLAAGRTQSAEKIPPYPAQAEWEMVRRDLELLREFPSVRYHVLHVSAKETLELLRKAQAQGLKATGEVTPHHLFFTADDIPSGDTSYKMNPPLRSAEDRAALRRALADGLLAFVSTDHAPHEPAKKGADFRASAFGTTGLETALRVLYSLVLSGELSRERLVEVFSTAPARFIGLDQEMGEIAVGRPFQAVFFDQKAPARPLQVSELESLSKNNCFLGAALPGRVAGVFNPRGFFRF